MWVFNPTLPSLPWQVFICSWSRSVTLGIVSWGCVLIFSGFAWRCVATLGWLHVWHSVYDWSQQRGIFCVKPHSLYIADFCVKPHSLYIADFCVKPHSLYIADARLTHTPYVSNPNSEQIFAGLIRIVIRSLCILYYVNLKWFLNCFLIQYSHIFGYWYYVLNLDSIWVLNYCYGLNLILYLSK